MDASLLSALSSLGEAIISGPTSLLASFFAQRSQARVLGSTVIGGMLAASGLAIFFIPVTFYVVERLSSRKRTGTQAPQPEPVPQPEAKPAAVATTS